MNSNAMERPPVPAPPDPFIDEVRELKRAASERSQHDLTRIVQRLREIQDRFPGRVVQAPPPPHPNAARVA